mgnify:CR=1 FL=1
MRKRSFQKCKMRLAALWAVSFGILLVIIVLQIYQGIYDDQSAVAIEIFLQHFVPTLSLIFGVFAYEQTKRTRDREIDSFLYYLAAGTSTLYIVLVAMSILIQPVVDRSPSDVLQVSTLWLAPLHALVSAAVGIFFVQRP